MKEKMKFTPIIISDPPQRLLDIIHKMQQDKEKRNKNLLKKEKHTYSIQL